MRRARATVTRARARARARGRGRRVRCWPARSSRPGRRVSRGNGLPVATSARSPVQRIRSSGSASHFDVGFDRGMMTGRSVCSAICRTIASVNAPACLEVPMSIVGRTRATMSASPTAPPVLDQPDTSAAGVVERAAQPARSPWGSGTGIEHAPGIGLDNEALYLAGGLTVPRGVRRAALTRSLSLFGKPRSLPVVSLRPVGGGAGSRCVRAGARRASGRARPGRRSRSA